MKSWISMTCIPLLTGQEGINNMFLNHFIINSRKMKKITLLFICIGFSIYLSHIDAQISISAEGSIPDASAMLDIQSANKGILIPRMTTAQRTLISNPANGLLVFDLTEGDFWYYNGSAWGNLITVPGIPNKIVDADGDTKIQVEESANEDHIRFDVGGNESMVIDNNGQVGIATSAPTDILHIGTFGGIRLRDSEIGNTSQQSGAILFDDNYFATGQIGDGHFNGNGGGLGIKRDDGWSAFISTANMPWLNMDVNSLHIGGSSIPGNDNLIVDGLISIAGGSPGTGKVLIADTIGNLTWKEVPEIINVISNLTPLYVSSDNDDDWHDISPAITMPIALETSFYKIEANLSLRLTGGSGIDVFEIRIKFNPSCSSTVFYGRRAKYIPYLDNGDGHDNFNLISFLDGLGSVELDTGCSNPMVDFTLQVRNTGDDNWEAKDIFLMATFLP